MPDDADPLAFLQGFDDAATDTDAADLLDLGAGNGLTVGDDGQCFEQGPRIPGRALVEQAIDPAGIIAAYLETIAAGDLDQFNTATLVILLQRLQRRANGFTLGQFRFILEQRQLTDIGLSLARSAASSMFFSSVSVMRRLSRKWVH